MPWRKNFALLLLATTWVEGAGSSSEWKSENGRGWFADRDLWHPNAVFRTGLDAAERWEAEAGRRLSGGYDEIKLTASDPATSAQFGSAVAIDGNYTIIGSDGGASVGYGSVYIFGRNADQTQTEVAKLTVPTGASYYFGQAVAISGAYAAIGDWRDDGSYAGAAYIFERNVDGSWTEAVTLRVKINDGRFARDGDLFFAQAKLVADDAAGGDQFSYFAVGISGETAVIGSYKSSCDDGNNWCGAAYVFGRENDGSWTQRAKLTASDASGNDMFGCARCPCGKEGGSRCRRVLELSMRPAPHLGDRVVHSTQAVSISGDDVVVGAKYDNNLCEDSDAGECYDTGSAYIFGRDAAGSWTQVAKLVASAALCGNGHTSGKSISIQELSTL